MFPEDSSMDGAPRELIKRITSKKATILAIRKNQYKNSTGSQQIGYKRDIEKLRYDIQLMFYNATVAYRQSQGGN